MQMAYVGTRSAVEAVLEQGFRRAFDAPAGVPLQRPGLAGGLRDGHAAIVLDIPDADLPPADRFSIPAGIADRYPVVAYRGVELRHPLRGTPTAVQRRGGVAFAAAAGLLVAVATAAAIPGGREERRKPLRHDAQPPKRAAAPSVTPSVTVTGAPARRRTTFVRVRRARSPATATRRPRKRRPASVRRLQRAVGVRADGEFGPRTQQALKEWQRSHGLRASGVAEPKTQEKLGFRASSALKQATTVSPVVERVIAAADQIATAPYRYGGGHGAVVDSGYDCSGSVSYALRGGGLLAAPLDSSGFMGYGLPGPGEHITIYANPGHVYMTIDGRRFDTSARALTGSRWSASSRSPAGYVVRHPPGL
jgi:cell wall-associated NlpC family hydrolase